MGNRIVLLAVVSIALVGGLAWRYTTLRANDPVRKVCAAMGSDAVIVTAYVNDAGLAGGYAAYRTDITDPATVLFDREGTQVDEISFFSTERERAAYDVSSKTIRTLFPKEETRSCR